MLGIMLVLVYLPILSYAEILLIESPIHHIGDETLYDLGLFSLKPESEGTEWSSSPFSLSFPASGTARVIFDCVDTEGSTILINGNSLGAIPWNSGADIWHNDLELEFNASLLSLNNNTIMFRSAQTAPTNYDDILFRNVRLEYVPEPATILLLSLGGLVLRKSRR